ncbi:DUF29 domain-containing protein [Dolichospermum sp. LEGE 00240]|jgi:hypothetical protein|uniref:DUF29 domain-containing protein n=1 Tax=Dolichospermum sp. LEGE 00240 TaxID=1828603 RepID=UPI00187FD45A|nr:DUF29 domain-containing protein [Dolichospermum sp. LEGE 00240]MBE9247923.1 DUF29 domain-containing protein [Dolichospermum sp. LEGE 00240]MDM3850102.1 DUF29 domain-containing protein [Aphanizomenon gracile PMC627.10]MDM3857580.1 DUF29 domain-containing protein [Aphanizomenon gracile PMC649.10]MDM3859897.1 DUF29 domain-containing protein [Aphanizomenon gracile PMC644.10]
MTEIQLAQTGLDNRDQYLWLEETILKLKARDFHGLDVEHLIEEMEILASRDRAEVESRLIVLWVHLLKRIYVNSEYDHRGWEVTIREQRRQLRILLKQSPSLKRYFTAVLDQAWQEALMEVREDYPSFQFPDVWEFSLNVDVLLSEKFWEYS